jgi:hypothetical protein
MRRLLSFSLVVPILALGCSAQPDLDIRTFNLENRSGYEAAELIQPYVFADREGAPGMMSATEAAVSVRETPDNLQKIARVLEEFDRPLPEVRLHFQLIEADSFQDPDPEIAQVVEQLGSLFTFQGYRLLGQALVLVAGDRGGGEFRQRFLGPDEEFLVTAAAELQSSGTVRLRNLTLWGEGLPVLESTINASAGQTLVIGGTRASRSGRSLILTVRPEIE